MVESSVRTHPKFLSAGPEASWLWLCGLGYCQDGLTDGFIPASAIEFLGVKNAAELADRLTTVRLWDVVDGGWRMHDYLKHNKPAEVIREIMQRRRDGGKLGGRPVKTLEDNLLGKPSDNDKANLPENPVLPVLPVLPSETEQRALASRPFVAPLLSFPVVGKGGPDWHLTKAQVGEWAELYPGLNILAEARKALAWVKSNDGHRKTASGMRKFLVNWFSRSVNCGGSQKSASWSPGGDWNCPHTPKCHARPWCESGTRDERDRQKAAADS